MINYDLNSMMGASSMSSMSMMGMNGLNGMSMLGSLDMSANSLAMGGDMGMEISADSQYSDVIGNYMQQASPAQQVINSESTADYINYMNGQDDAGTAGASSAAATNASATTATASSASTSQTAATSTNTYENSAFHIAGDFDYTNLGSGLQSDYAGTVTSYLTTVLGMDEESAAALAETYATQASEMMEIFGTSSGSLGTSTGSSTANQYDNDISKYLESNFNLDSAEVEKLTSYYTSQYDDFSAQMSAATQDLSQYMK